MYISENHKQDTTNFKVTLFMYKNIHLSFNRLTSNINSQLFGNQHCDQLLTIRLETKSYRILPLTYGTTYDMT